MISKNLVAKVLMIFIVGSSLIMPMVASASSNGTYTNPSLWPTGYWGPLVSCTGNYISTTNSDGTPVNACTNLCDLIGTFINIIYFAMSIGIFIITPLAFLVGAIMVMVSGANPEMLSTGKNVLKTTAIGLAIILCSYLLVATVVSVLGISGVGGFGAAICSVKS
jgi:hypothetical protein